MGQHGKYLFWLQLFKCLSNFYAVFTDGLRKWTSFVPDQRVGATVPLGTPAQHLKQYHIHPKVTVFDGDLGQYHWEFYGILYTKKQL